MTLARAVACGLAVGGILVALMIALIVALSTPHTASGQEVTVTSVPEAGPSDLDWEDIVKTGRALNLTSMKLWTPKSPHPQANYGGLAVTKFMQVRKLYIQNCIIVKQLQLKEPQLEDFMTGRKDNRANREWASIQLSVARTEWMFAMHNPSTLYGGCNRDWWSIWE